MEIVQEKNRFTHLLNALETGWEIEEPVLIGKLWRTKTEGGAYHFVLKNKLQEKTTLVSVTPSSQLLVFLAENNISISAL
jgi:hypothetical protein